MKRIYLLSLSLCLCASVVAFAASLTGTLEIDGQTYDIQATVTERAAQPEPQPEPEPTPEPMPDPTPEPAPAPIDAPPGTPSRSSGMVPLAVFYDDWASSRGPDAFAARVYDQPGTYGQVTAEPPAWNTIHIDKNTSFDAAIDQLSTGVQLLFERGGSWTTARPHVIATPGPWLIGAYGDGADPVIRMTAGNTDDPLIGLRCDDGRIEYLDLRGFGDKTVGLQLQKCRNILIRNVSATNFRLGISTSWECPEQVEGVAVLGCAFNDNTINNGYLAGHSLAIVGTTFNNCAGSHCLRIFHATDLLLADCEMLDAGGDRLALKVHNERDLKSRPGMAATERIVIRDCVFRANAKSPYTVSIAPQAWNYTDEIQRDVFIHNNRLEATAGSTELLVIRADRVSVTGNTFDGTAATSTPQALNASGDAITAAGNTYTAVSH